MSDMIDYQYFQKNETFSPFRERSYSWDSLGNESSYLKPRRDSFSDFQEYMANEPTKKVVGEKIIPDELSLHTQMETNYSTDKQEPQEEFKSENVMPAIFEEQPSSEYVQEEELVEEQKQGHQARNQNSVKNYVAITTKTFGNFFGKDEGDMDSKVRDILNRTCISHHIKTKERVLNYIKNCITGKSKGIKSSQKCKQYKVVSQKDINKVFLDEELDCNETKELKSIVRDLFSKFMKSSIFSDWVQQNYSPAEPRGRKFYLNSHNVQQIVGKITIERFRPSFI